MIKVAICDDDIQRHGHWIRGMAMKNILKIMLMMITIFTIAGSAVYATEIPVSDQDQLITSRDWTEISNLQDEMKKKSRMQPSIMTRL